MVAHVGAQSTRDRKEVADDELDAVRHAVQRRVVPRHRNLVWVDVDGDDDPGRIGARELNRVAANAGERVDREPPTARPTRRTLREQSRGCCCRRLRGDGEPALRVEAYALIVAGEERAALVVVPLERRIVRWQHAAAPREDPGPSDHRGKGKARRINRREPKRFVKPEESREGAACWS